MHKHLHFIVAAALCCAVATAVADNTDIVVKEYRHAGPYPILKPVMLDSLDATQKAFDVEKVMEESMVNGQWSMNNGQCSIENVAAELHLLSFDIEAKTFAKAKVNVNGVKHSRIYLDGQPSAPGTELQLTPAARHTIVVKVAHPRPLPKGGEKGPLPTNGLDSLSIVVSTETPEAISVGKLTSPRSYNISDVIHAKRISGASVSADGKWAIVSTRRTLPGGQMQTKTLVIELATQRVVDEREGIRWLCSTPRYCFERTDGQGRRELIARDPATGAETTLAKDLPQGGYYITPDDKSLIYYFKDDGPAERKEIYQVIHPDDRQPSWRSRYRLARYDIATGIMQPLTHSNANISLLDISADSRYALIALQRSRLTQRPTTLMTILRIDLQTLAADTIVAADGFVNNAVFAGDINTFIAQGSPEAFGGIGANVDEGQTPSMIDSQLFLIGRPTPTPSPREGRREVNGQWSARPIGTLASARMVNGQWRVAPLTRDFNPCVQRIEWCNGDGKLYFTAEDRDSINVFQADIMSGEIRQIALPEEVVLNMDVAFSAPVLVVTGQSASNSDRLYALTMHNSQFTIHNEKKRGRNSQSTMLQPQRTLLVADASAENLEGIELGACREWIWRNEGGDDIQCRYYLPPHFDAEKRYPMIVNYYGGCSPTSRHFETRYPHHAYAAQDYVVLVINPSGATGYGQRFSARHVATAGHGPAEDIIGATKAFAAEHSYVDAQHIGCIGASYGGFMTQYLLTQTDIFATGISHAGISDHTSYWGEGYWGYSYSEVSMANRYPWADRQLYVDQSPLYLADRIHSPLLLLHGDADTNVPPGESIQMYNALKLLGREVEMVLVSQQDHHIMDYTKRLLWEQTIEAWFARYLKGDATWWNTMYPEKKL